MIREAIAALYKPGDVVELRVLKTKKGTVAGFFDDHEALARAAEEWDGQGQGVYVTLNPVDPELLNRICNKVATYADRGVTATDNDVVLRRWLPIDIDPVRKSGISSTQAELDHALALAHRLRNDLLEKWGEPLMATSGNGAHLLYPIEWPNDEDHRQIAQWTLDQLAIQYSTDKVTVDAKNFNAARIWKLYGTLSRKGVNSANRPHRRAEILSLPA